VGGKLPAGLPFSGEGAPLLWDGGRLEEV